MKKQITIQISNLLTQEDWKSFQIFNEKAKELRKTKLVTTGDGTISAEMRYERGKGLWFDTKLPSNELISELLIAFRVFYLKKELSYFPRIINIFTRHIQIPEAINLLKSYKKQWDNNLFKQALFVSVNDKPITSAKILDLWFNAYYFHSDEEKKGYLTIINDTLTEPFSKYMLLDAVFESTKLILKVHDSMKNII